MVLKIRWSIWLSIVGDRFSGGNLKIFGDQNCGGHLKANLFISAAIISSEHPDDGN